MTIIVRAFAGLAVLTLSFVLTLLIIDYTPEPSAMDLAMAAEGLTAADAVVGYVDLAKRDPAGRLELTGWAFDKELANPVSVQVLVGTKFEPIAITNGAREDVTRALQESPERTKNVAFTGRTDRPVDCGSYTIVGVNHRNHMSILVPSLDLPGCRPY